ncbi:MAG: CHRD domain-containing protein [Sediminibacterium sp.]
MKQLFNSLTKGSLFASFILTTALLFTSCTKDDATVTTAITYSLSGNASGSQSVPASSNANGSGTMSGTYNSSTRLMSYTTTWSNLTGAPISGGLYTGVSGQIGTSISAWSLGSGLSTSGSFSGSTTLNADQEAKLLAGQAYYILSTTANASGEIRGQITASAQ